MTVDTRHPSFSPIGFFSRLRSFIRRFEKSIISEREASLNKSGINYWRQRIFLLLSVFIIFACAPLFLFGSYMFFIHGQIPNSIIEIGTYILMLVLLRHKGISAGYKALGLVLILYIFSIMLLIEASVNGSGMICVLVCLFISGSMLERKQLYWFVGVDILTFAVMTVLLMSGFFDGTLMEAYKSVWAINAFTTQVCGIGLLTLFSIFYRGLDRQAQLTKRSQKLLEESERLFRIAVEKAPVPIMLHTDDGEIVKLSNAWTDITGYALKDIPTVSDWVMKAYDVGNDFPVPSFSDLEGKKYASERSIRTSAGEKRVWDVYYSYMGKFSDNRNMMMTIAADTTMKKQVEEQYRAFIQTSLDGFFIADSTGRILDANSAYCKMSGYSREELVGMSISDIEVIEKSEETAKHLEKIMNNGPERFETKNRRRDGGVIDVEVSCNYLHDSGTFYIFTRDITERKNWESNIIYLSSHDTLTNLYNRTWFLKEAARLNSEENLPLSVIVGDINGLKLINDAVGHDAGDRILLCAAKMLVNCSGKQAIVARTGGDEFGVLLPRTSAEAARDIIKKINAACEAYNKKKVNRLHYVSISLGYGTKTGADESMDSVIKAAGDHMHRQKLLEQKSLRSSIIASIRTTMYEKNQETEEHAERLIYLSKAVGRRLGLTDDELNELELLAVLHDIGKIGISEGILNKPGKLTDEEWVEMKKHPEIGFRIAMSTVDLVPIAHFILYHHERWDGKGYPEQLKETEIPVLSRIIAIVDAYDAMISERPYKRAFTEKEAVREIRANAGTQFDPVLSGIFLEVLGYGSTEQSACL